MSRKEHIDIIYYIYISHYLSHIHCIWPANAAGAASHSVEGAESDASAGSAVYIFHIHFVLHITYPYHIIH